MVVWVTGLSGAGKTTLCQALNDLLKSAIPELVLIDSEEVREIFNDRLGHSVADRLVQLRRMQRLAKALSDQDLVVLVAVLYAPPEILAWNRANLGEYFEVYLDAPLSLVMERDPKGLYAKAMRGEESDVVGIDIPWIAPEKPDLTIDVAPTSRPDELAREVAHTVPRFAAALAQPR